MSIPDEYEFDTEGVEPTRFPDVEMARDVIKARERKQGRKKLAKSLRGPEKTRYRRRPEASNYGEGGY